ncbi:MAG: Rne/Rng family ribonuclease [Marmoricola sp.]
MLDNDDNTTDNSTDNSAQELPEPAGPAPDQPDQGSPSDSRAESPSDTTSEAPVKKAAAKRTAAKKTGAAPAKKAAAKRTAKKAAHNPESEQPLETAPAQAPETASETGPETGPDAGAPAEPPRKRAPARKRAAAKTAVADAATGSQDAEDAGSTEAAEGGEENTPVAPMVLFKTPETQPKRKRTTKKAAAEPAETGQDSVDEPIDELAAEQGGEESEETPAPAKKSGKSGRSQKSEKSEKSQKSKSGDETASDAAGAAEAAAADNDTDNDADNGADNGADDDPDNDSENEADTDDDSSEGEGGARRRRRRGGRRRRKPSDGNGEDTGERNGRNGGDKAASGENAGSTEDSDSSDSNDDGDEDGEGSGSRRRRRRRRTGDDSEGSDNGDRSSDRSGERGGGRSRGPRNPEDEITSIGGSTRLEAKKQRRREGREAGRRRAPIVSEAEFLARRESVDRTMVIRQRDDLTQIGVIEDKVLVEHYVARESQTSLIGNVYLGRVQNVLPSMEAAFIDIGKGRNAVIYAGEVNWAALGHKDGQQRKIESVLSSGQTILVQVSKDPIGHKGARLTGQISLPGRFLVYVPDGNTSGISRKLPDTERNRLKTLLKEIVPDTAGVIVRTAAEGATEEELTLDVERLTARWADIETKVQAGKGPELLYGEPDLTLKVVRDLFTEDFAKLVIEGDDAWDLVDGYVSHVAPDLRERLERFVPGDNGKDIFASYRVDEQIAKGLDRKVWLPSGGSLVIDRTEAMTVVDVNTGKFTGSGGNLEETVTKNNLEAAEEIVRQLRLRDIGGIIVVDFIDMVLESNRDLVLRRLVECLGRDRTRHQVAEVTSLGLVQMTRKRIGTGLVESFSKDCDHCKGRGVVIQDQPVDPGGRVEDEEPRGRRSRGGGGGGGGGGRGRTGAPRDGGNQGGNGGSQGGNQDSAAPAKPSPKDLAGTRPVEKPSEAPAPADEAVADQPADKPADKPAEQPAQQQEPEAPAPQEPALSQELAQPDAAQPEPAQPEPAQPQTPAAPEPPRVVTSSRRRTARRPAGPPPAVTAPVIAAVPQEQQHEPGASAPDSEPVQVLDNSATEAPIEESDSSAGSVLHVPVKRKGTRKR